MPLAARIFARRRWFAGRKTAKLTGGISERRCGATSRPNGPPPTIRIAAEEDEEDGDAEAAKDSEGTPEE